MLCIDQPPGSAPAKKFERESPQLPAPPPHIAFGTPEDTLAGCTSFSPKPPKKDVVRELYNFPKKLRYHATMEAVHPEDEDRDFIVEYALSDGKITISEIEKKNSGRRGGCFLSPTLVAKPGTGRDDPAYYTPEDFFIGAKINIFNHRFVINGIDLFVYRYVEANPEKFCRELRDNLRNHVIREGMLGDEVDRQAQRLLEDHAENAQPEVAVPADTMEDYVRSCQDEILPSRREDGERSLRTMEEERCREMLYPRQEDRKAPEASQPLIEAAERKQIAWADQVGPFYNAR